MTTENIEAMLREKYGAEGILGVDNNSQPQAIIVSHTVLTQVCDELYRNEQTFFDMLSCITAIDNGVEENTMEVVYNLYSIPYEVSLGIKVKIDRSQPQVPTVSTVWKTADWHEREAYDLMGIIFTDHPDMRRILLPADWEGHPLRKDYKHQTHYRGIKVEY